MPLILRSSLTRPLTTAEMDGNFSYLNNLITTVSTTPGPTGPTGPKGDTGDTGAAGAPGTFPVGTNRTITGSSAAINADNNGIITANSSSAIVVTIPNDSTGGWTGNEFLTLFQLGTGVVSFAAGAGVTLRVASDTPPSTQYGTIAAYRRGANEWVLV